jgi:hypothetical protein
MWHGGVRLISRGRSTRVATLSFGGLVLGSLDAGDKRLSRLAALPSSEVAALALAVPTAVHELAVWPCGAAVRCHVRCSREPRRAAGAARAATGVVLIPLCYLFICYSLHVDSRLEADILQTLCCGSIITN